MQQDQLLLDKRSKAKRTGERRLSKGCREFPRLERAAKESCWELLQLLLVVKTKPLDATERKRRKSDDLASLRLQLAA